mmetsp:Transcript_7779/g.14817  ORF Transcript_7779/g.14817 Transcript_7779/m.14817 type:complete len:256 (-) Transcript_7779:1240-2007(-)
MTQKSAGFRALASRVRLAMRTTSRCEQLTPDGNVPIINTLISIFSPGVRYPTNGVIAVVSGELVNTVYAMSESRMLWMVKEASSCTSVSNLIAKAIERGVMVTPSFRPWLCPTRSSIFSITISEKSFLVMCKLVSWGALLRRARAGCSPFEPMPLLVRSRELSLELLSMLLMMALKPEKWSSLLAMDREVSRLLVRKLLPIHLAPSAPKPQPCTSRTVRLRLFLIILASASAPATPISLSRKLSSLSVRLYFRAL